MVSQNSNTCLQSLTFCILFGLACALIGDKVRIAKKDECPYVVSISNKAMYDNAHGNLHFCTGVLIKERSVLTAAHCLKDKKPSEVDIIAGSRNLLEGKRYFPESWITYEEWKNDTHHTQHTFHDIAVILLQGDGIINIPPVYVMPVPEENLVNETIKILGWGNVKNGRQPFHLRTAVLTVISREECSAIGTKLKAKHFSVPSDCFCSKAEPFVMSTNGDGGAPLLIKKNYLIGINIGVCPKLEGNYTSEFLHQNLLNSHLLLNPYKDFLKHASK